MQPFLPSDPSVSPQRVLDTLYTSNEENVHNFGFTVDPTWSRWDRVCDVILQMHPRCYFNHLTQMSYHNLCSTLIPPTQMPYHNLCLTLIPPPGTHPLLGMSEKYCIERGHPRGTDIMFKRNLSRFARSVHIRLALQHLNTDKESYSLGLYIPSNGNLLWQMPMLKPILWNLLKDWNDLHASKRCRNHFNLNPQQYWVLHTLKWDCHFIVVLTD
jgi:hypothetical protein